jgi:hypothetical protein
VYCARGWWVERVASGGTIVSVPPLECFDALEYAKELVFVAGDGFVALEVGVILGLRGEHVEREHGE